MDRYIGLFACCLALALSASARQIEEGHNVTVPFKSSGTNILARYWYKGKFSSDNQPDDSTKLFAMFANEEPIKKNAREDMSIAENTKFDLFIKLVQLADNGYFTCETTDKDDVKRYEQPDPLSVYIQPKVDIETDVQPEEGVNITVTCTVNRLYPNITDENKFKMYWGRDQVLDAQFTADVNGDGSTKYVIEKSKNLTAEDDGKIVECKIMPKIGDNTSAQRTLNMTGPQTTPKPSGAAGFDSTRTLGLLLYSLLMVMVAILPANH